MFVLNRSLNNKKDGKQDFSGSKVKSYNGRIITWTISWIAGDRLLSWISCRTRFSIISWSYTGTNLPLLPITTGHGTTACITP